MKKLCGFIVLLGIVIMGQYIEAKQTLDPRGKPAYPLLEQANFLIWQDQVGWHVRWKSKGEKHRFTGVIRTKGGSIDFVQSITPYPQKKTLQWNEKRIKFETIDNKFLDGFDFMTTSKKIYFKFLIDGKRCAKCIFIGTHSKNPNSAAFSLIPHEYGLLSGEQKTPQ